jgi:hypothetical protein
MAEFPECGDMIPASMVIASESGGLLPLFLTGSDPDIGGTVDQIVNMTTESGDFVSAGLSSDKSFMILIETAAPIVVQLLNGDDFTITQAQADAYLGQWYPAKILKVYKTGSTGTFSPGR